jgi:hypothetical protein
VLDFVNLRGGNDNHGKLISRMIRKQLKDNFNVLDERDTLVDTTTIKDIISNTEAVLSIAKQLDVDAIIIGGYEFGERYQAIPYIVDRYSPRTGRLTPEGRTYIQRLYYLKFQAKVIDAKTGEVIFDYSPAIEEKPDYGSSSNLPFSDDLSDASNIRNIAFKPVRNFVMSVTPHYEVERRILVK